MNTNWEKKGKIAVMSIESVNLSFGGVDALRDVSLHLNKNELLALIGPNGAGKTCVLNCINGFYKPDKGNIQFKDFALVNMGPNKIAKLGIGRTFQHTELFMGLTAIDNLMAARHLFVDYNPFSGIFFL